MATLPIPSAAARAQSAELTAIIQQNIADNGGWIDFASFMHGALYTPHLGYYSGGAKKFGLGGDFVTAPEISPLFARTVALQVKQVLAFTQGSVLELGAGTGKLALGLMLALAQFNQLPELYYILEVSDYLRQKQSETLKAGLSAELFSRVVWLNALPKHFNGVIIGNEVLDAIPVHLIYKNHDTLFERGVCWQNAFTWQDKPLTAKHLQLQASAYPLPNDYLTEFCPTASGLIASLGECLQQGIILMLDYGFGALEYYHPQRNAGTLMCHFQHYAHSNPLINVGLQDVTAHVNFTAIAEAAIKADLTVMGYANQASFLINCGMLDEIAKVSPTNMAAYAPLAAAAQKLLSPAEMGELFKVIAFGKGVNLPLIGFVQGDKRHTL